MNRSEAGFWALVTGTAQLGILVGRAISFFHHQLPADLYFTAPMLAFGATIAFSLASLLLRRDKNPPCP